MPTETHPLHVLSHASARVNSREFVDYASTRTGQPPSPIAATLLHLPGLYCWIIYACLVFNSHILRRNFDDFAVLTLLVWPIAFITAIISMILYLGKKRRRPWYVWINLAVNISGVIFTLLCPFMGSLLSRS